LENMLWRNASTLAIAMGKTPEQSPAEGRPVTQRYRANVQAFLDWLPPADRKLWEELMVDLRSLVTAFQSLPRTLLHGDPAERNIGLRWLQADGGTSQKTECSAELVLIDWEWPCIGPAALDIGIVLTLLPWSCDWSQPCPDFCWSEELPNYYLEPYGSAGGIRLDAETWRRSYDLARVAWAVALVPGSGSHIIRVLQGLAPIPRSTGVPEDVMLQYFKTGLDRLERTIDAITRGARRWLSC
jgi:hypothetical protein